MTINSLNVKPDVLSSESEKLEQAKPASPADQEINKIAQAVIYESSPSELRGDAARHFYEAYEPSEGPQSQEEVRPAEEIEEPERDIQRILQSQEYADDLELLEIAAEEGNNEEINRIIDKYPELGITVQRVGETAEEYELRTLDGIPIINRILESEEYQNDMGILGEAARNQDYEVVARIIEKYPQLDIQVQEEEETFDEFMLRASDDIDILNEASRNGNYDTAERIQAKYPTISIQHPGY